MNDRFRFRIWFEIGKKYAYFGKPIINIKGLGRAEGTGLLFEILPGQTMYLGNNNIEQCTGLKDKNGNLIYEGDIVKFKISSIKCVGAVRWDEHTGGWLKDKTGQPLHTYIKSVEVIGNIHENPELLESVTNCNQSEVDK